jgi:hypothetical protein
MLQPGHVVNPPARRYPLARRQDEDRKRFEQRGRKRPALVARQLGLGDDHSYLTGEIADFRPRRRVLAAPNELVMQADRWFKTCTDHDLDLRHTFWQRRLLDATQHGMLDRPDKEARGNWARLDLTPGIEDLLNGLCAVNALDQMGNRRAVQESHGPAGPLCQNCLDWPDQIAAKRRCLNNAYCFGNSHSVGQMGQHVDRWLQM